MCSSDLRLMDTGCDVREVILSESRGGVRTVGVPLGRLRKKFQVAIAGCLSGSRGGAIIMFWGETVVAGEILEPVGHS